MCIKYELYYSLYFVEKEYSDSGCEPIVSYKRWVTKGTAFQMNRPLIIEQSNFVTQFLMHEYLRLTSPNYKFKISPYVTSNWV